MDSQRASQVASIGLAVRACAPSLMHAIRGSLHGVSMLATLLQAPDAAGADESGAETKSAQRLRALQAQLSVLERQIALLGGVMAWPRGGREDVCATASALPDVLRLLKDEAAHRRIGLDVDIAALPPHVFADERALQQALLTCGAWAAQQLDTGAMLRLSGREEDGDAVFEFDATAPSIVTGLSPNDEHSLLAALVAAAGGALVTAPHLRLAFKTASERDVRTA